MLRALRLGTLALAGFIVPLEACSLVVGNPPVVSASCTSNTDCDPLNVAEHIAETACLRWQCDRTFNGGHCRITPRDKDGDGDPAIDPACPSTSGHDCNDNDDTVFASGSVDDAGTAGAHVEWCDDKDNNCNGIVDESATSRHVTTSVAIPLPGIERVGIAQSNGTQVTTSIHTANLENVASIGATITPASPLAFGIRTSNSTDDHTATDCPGNSTGCVVNEGAIDGGDLPFVAGITTTSGCGTGTLHVGYHRAGGAANVVLRDYEGLSNVFAGIDRSFGDCNGRCTAPSGTAGAVHPAIAAMQRPNGPPQAVVTYLNAPQSYRECTRQPADVRALGVWLMDVAGSSTTHWVMGAGNGRSTLLGRSNGDPAAMATLNQRGYFVAYGTDTGNISLHFIPALGDAALIPLDNTDVALTDASQDGTCNIHDAGSGSGTLGHIVGHYEACADCMPTPLRAADGIPPFPAVQSGMLATHGTATNPATHVAIAVTPQVQSIVDIGVTWVENAPPCDMRPVNASVWFSRVRFDGVANTFTGTTPVQVSPMGIGADSQSVTYVDHGFVTPGFTRNSMTADRDGGFYVAYVDYSANEAHVRMRRVAAFDGGLIDEAPIDLTDPSVTAGVATPRLYPLGRAAEPVNFVYGSYSSAMAGVIAGSITCRAP